MTKNLDECAASCIGKATDEQSVDFAYAFAVDGTIDHNLEYERAASAIGACDAKGGVNAVFEVHSWHDEPQPPS